MIYYLIWTKSPYKVLSSLWVHWRHQCPLALHISIVLSQISGANGTKLNLTEMLILWSSTFFYGIFVSFGNSILAKISKILVSETKCVMENYYMVECPLYIYIYEPLWFCFCEFQYGCSHKWKMILLSNHWTIWNF